MKHKLKMVSLLTLLTCGAVRADDWMQFRHDASRSGISKDTLKFPLKETWTWKTKGNGGYTPLFHAVVRKGKIYFIASDKFKRALICADAKTGTILWHTPLNVEKLSNALADTVGPSVSDSGKVFVYDWRFDVLTEMVRSLTTELQKNWNDTVCVSGNGIVSFSRSWQDIRQQEQAYKRELVPILPSACIVFTSIVQTYDAEKGTPGLYFPMAWTQVNGAQPRIMLLESEDDPRPLPPDYRFRPRELQWIEDHRYLGFPLLQGDLFSATTQTDSPYIIHGGSSGDTPLSGYTPLTDILLRWLPGETASVERLHHPLPNLDLEVSHTAVLGGYPLTQSPKGLIVSDDSTHRFFGMVSTSHEKHWHHDIGNSLGIATTAGELVVAGYGGESATHGMFAVNSKDGELLWTYPKKILPPEKQEYRTVVGHKSVTNIVMAENAEGIENVAVVKKGKTTQTYRSKALVPTQQTKLVPIPVRQPLSVKPRAHERNPGIISVGSLVIGQVQNEIVALNRETGEPVWSYPLEKNQAVRSLVGTPEHVVACISSLSNGGRRPVWEKDPPLTKHFLVALSIKKGEKVWEQKVGRPGNLIIADSRLYLMNGELHAFEAVEEQKETIELGTEAGGQNALSPTNPEP